MSFEKMALLNWDAAYYKSFGDLPHEFRYYDPWKDVDLRKDIGRKMRDIILKAVGTSAATVPVYLDTGLVDVTARETPFLSLIPRVTNKGKSADYVKITAKPTVSWVQEGGTLSSSDPTYASASANIAFLYAVGEVTGPYIAAAAGSPVFAGKTAKEQEIQNQFRALKIKEEETLLRGTTNNGDDTDIYVYNQYGYDGLIKSITSNTVNAAGATIDLTKFRQAVRLAREDGGTPDIAVTDWKTFDDLRGVLTDYARYTNTTDLKFGIKAMEVDGLPVIATTQMPNTDSKRIMLILDMDVIEMRVLQDVVVEDLAKTKDTEQFMLKLYEVGIVKAEQFCSKIYGLA